MNLIESFLEAHYLLDMLIDNREDSERCTMVSTPLMPVNIPWKRYGEWLRLTLISGEDLFIVKHSTEETTGDVTLGIGIHVPWSKDQLSFKATISKEGFDFLLKEIKAFQKKHFPTSPIIEDMSAFWAVRIKCGDSEGKDRFMLNCKP